MDHRSETGATRSAASDGELVVRAQRGDRAAFGELVVRWQDRVFNTCYRMCASHADAADLTQATFLKALEGLRTFEHKASFYTWLFRIAVNQVLSHRRTQRRRPVLPLDGPHAEDRAPDPPARAADCEAGRAAEQHELQQRVARALAAIDEEFRAAVVLKDIEGMDYVAIAEVLAVPVGTVKSRIHRGRLLLRELLADVVNGGDRGA